MSKTILIVDDSELTLEITSFAISEAGYKTLTAQNGLEALEILHKEAVDLMVVDIIMPDMDGFTLVRKIREGEEYSEKPVIIMTTQTGAKDKQKGFEAGANVYLIKPVHGDEMVAQIELLIGEA
jgi:two-component system chemotaxis response regulator CheY